MPFANVRKFKRKLTAEGIISVILIKILCDCIKIQTNTGLDTGCRLPVGSYYSNSRSGLFSNIFPHQINILNILL